jgi:SYP7 family syntaxin
MASGNNLNVLMQKLYSMEKVVGVVKGDASSVQNADEFNTIKATVNETLVAIRKKMDEKDQKVARFSSNLETVKMTSEIKEKLQSLDKQLGQMNEVLRKQKKDKNRYGASELEIKEKTYNNFLAQMKDLKARERGVAPTGELKTLSEMKTDLSGKMAPGQRGVQRDLTAEESEALDRWKEGDKQQDAVLTLINDGLSTLHNKANNIGNQVDAQTKLITKLDEDMEDAYKELESSNTRLKKVLVEYRKPGKFCMDIALVLILLGLIGVIIKLL